MSEVSHVEAAPLQTAFDLTNDHHNHIRMNEVENLAMKTETKVAPAPSPEMTSSKHTKVSTLIQAEERRLTMKRIERFSNITRAMLEDNSRAWSKHVPVQSSADASGSETDSITTMSTSTKSEFIHMAAVPLQSAFDLTNDHHNHKKMDEVEDLATKTVAKTAPTSALEMASSKHTEVTRLIRAEERRLTRKHHSAVLAPYREITPFPTLPSAPEMTSFTHVDPLLEVARLIRAEEKRRVMPNKIAEANVPSWHAENCRENSDESEERSAVKSKAATTPETSHASTLSFADDLAKRVLRKKSDSPTGGKDSTTTVGTAKQSFNSMLKGNKLVTTTAQRKDVMISQPRHQVQLHLEMSSEVSKKNAAKKPPIPTKPSNHSASQTPQQKDFALELALKTSNVGTVKEQPSNSSPQHNDFALLLAKRASEVMTRPSAPIP